LDIVQGGAKNKDKVVTVRKDQKKGEEDGFAGKLRCESGGPQNQLMRKEELEKSKKRM